MDTNNKRIFKNTIYLYVRMLVIMCIGFFTTRVVLEKLGISDYGIYNVVGGFVSMFTVLNSILQASTNRFMALGIGKGDKETLKVTFSTAYVIHLIIAFVVFILLESIGIWFINNKMVIDPQRLYAANWVFQLSVVSCLLTIIQTPYNSAIVSHEKFNIFAFLSIFDVTYKLIVLYLLVIIPGDKLIVYAVLLLIGTILNRLFSHLYCIRHFEECKYSLKVDKRLTKEMLSFSGWGVLGHICSVLNGSGVTVLINMFFGTVVNAANGLSNTVTFTIQQFIGGFIMAAEPQLVKYYANDEKENFVNLIFNISRITLFLLSLFLIPVLLEVDYVLNLWLTEVPEYTASFIKITLIVSFLIYSNRMVDFGINAIGRVKELNMWSTIAWLADLPLCYVLLKLGGSPTVVCWVSMAPAIYVFFMNMYILNKFYYFPILKYSVNVIGKTILIVVVASMLPLYIQSNMEDGIVRFLIVCGCSVFCTIILFWLWGLNKENKEMIKQKIFDKYIKLLRK